MSWLASDRIGRWMNESTFRAALVYYGLGFLGGMAFYALLAGK